MGFGRWGPNFARVLAAHPQTRLVGIADRDEARAARACASYPHVGITSDARELLERADVELIAIATEPENHFLLANAALEAGKHVLVAKPMAITLAETRALAALAAARGLELLVDHTVLFAPATRALKRYADTGRLGAVARFDSIRANTEPPTTTTDVVWDLASHDVAVLRHLTGRPVRQVVALATTTGSAVTTSATLSLLLDDGSEARCAVTWTGEARIRTITLSGSAGAARYDNDGPRHSLSVSNGYGVHLPVLSRAEALFVECGHVARVIRCGERAISDGPFAVEVAVVLDAASRSIEAAGAPIGLLETPALPGRR
ncbi:MAG: Gfo/Idh/MocA family oxidoreductase [Chloroflexi bacterium]|nr:Gfo/Idh/MocA family oxidoreductase [Chloroflexota bacterium]